jgi:hypothetical protein
VLGLRRVREVTACRGHEISKVSHAEDHPILAACGIHPTPSTTEPAEQPDAPPDDPIKPRDNVYFCCVEVDVKTKSGEGCVTIGEKQLDACGSFLVCADGAAKKDGVVTCF